MAKINKNQNTQKDTTAVVQNAQGGTVNITVNGDVSIINSESLTYGQLKDMLPSTGKGKVPGLKKMLADKPKVVLQASVGGGDLTVYGNGFYTYVSDEHTTVYGVDRCSRLVWESVTGERITVGEEHYRDMPWAVPLEIAGDYRLSVNSSSREDDKGAYFLDAYDDDRDEEFSVRPEFDVRMEQEEEAERKAQEYDRLHKALDKLTDRQREIVDLYYWKKMTQEQIAKATGLTRFAVRTHMDRALAKLKKFI